MEPIFITGIGTGVGKTLIAAIVTEALGAHYWKPVQAGFADGTDSEWVRERISAADVQRTARGGIKGCPELYKLKLPASPHIAAREEGIVISLDKIRPGRKSGRLAGRSPTGRRRRRRIAGPAE